MRLYRPLLVANIALLTLITGMPLEAASPARPPSRDARPARSAPGNAALPLAPPLAAPAILLTRAISNESGTSDIGAGVWPIDGGALLSGWTSKGSAPADGLLMRVTDDGDVVWRKQLGRAGVDLLWTILPDPNGGFVCAGFTGSQGAGSLDGWLIHFDADGQVDWERTYGGVGEDRLTSMQAITDGWMIVGQTSSPPAHGVDGWVLRVGRDGAERSSWVVGGEEIERAFGILPMADGGCIIGGMVGLDLDRIETFDSYLTRIGPDGQVVWTHREKLPGLQVTHDIRRTRDGEFVAVGYGHVDDVRGIDAFALRVSNDGTVRAKQRFGGPTYDRANHAEILADGSIVIVGYSQRPGATDEEHGWDLVVYLLDPTGTPRSSYRFGGTGYEYGRSVVGAAEDLWVVGHTSSGRSGSGVLVVRLEVPDAAGPTKAGSR